MEHDGTNNIRVWVTELAVGVLADVEIDRRVQARAAAWNVEVDNCQLGNIQNL